MASVTIRFSILLVLLGVLFFVLTGSSHPTALIPTFFGVALFLLGLLARTDNARRRMIVMHIAVTVALLGFLFPLGRVLAGWAKNGVIFGMAVREELLMSVICLVLVLLCVRSFIAARKARLG
ncbi:MAG TPA: hypothetical protein VNU94_06625 [Acidobacteriaceae bacterium]|jgi:hypothetical protein|nr:hypothetical protein [Acidobacteriaceae bacterium]